jgi:hypothetical protein
VVECGGAGGSASQSLQCQFDMLVRIEEGRSLTGNEGLLQKTQSVDQAGPPQRPSQPGTGLHYQSGHAGGLQVLAPGSPDPIDLPWCSSRATIGA